MANFSEIQLDQAVRITEMEQERAVSLTRNRENGVVYTVKERNTPQRRKERAVARSFGLLYTDLFKAIIMVRQLDGAWLMLHFLHIDNCDLS